MTATEITNTELIAEQLRHTIDLLRADNAALRQDLAHDRELADRRLADLESCKADFEQRIRALTESATQFKFLVTLSAGGGLLSVIALLRELFK